MTIGERIKEQREKQGMLQIELAKIIKATKQTMNKYENNIITNIPSDRIEQIAKALNTTPAYLMGWEESPSPPLPPNLTPMPKLNKRIPILGTIACGQPILAAREDTEYVDIDSLISADFALYCKGDSMIEAGINAGDLVCIREQPNVDDGEIAAVIIEDYEAEVTLKKIYRRHDVVILRPCNMQHDDIVIPLDESKNIRIIGKATHCIKNL